MIMLVEPILGGAGQSRGATFCISYQPGLPVIDIVAWVRHHGGNAKLLTALQFSDQTVYGAVP